RLAVIGKTPKPMTPGMGLWWTGKSPCADPVCVRINITQRLEFRQGTRADAPQLGFYRSNIAVTPLRKSAGDISKKNQKMISSWTLLDLSKWKTLHGYPHCRR